ncbi:MAG: phage portal protein [Chloroflexota bacterium]
MGFLTGLFEKRALEMPAAWERWLGNMDAASGVTVTEYNALQYAAVFGAVRILAESCAVLPLLTYRRLDRRGRERASDFYLYDILAKNPNPEMTAYEFRETLTGHLATWGNGYAEIEWGNDGRVRGLWPLRPDRMRVQRINGELVYRFSLGTGEPKLLSSMRVLHLRGLGFDGLVGYSPIALQRQMLGLGMAAEEFGARFFGNDARPGGVLEHPGELSPNAHKNLLTSWESRHQGLSKQHRIGILEEGMSYKQIGIPPGDAQFLETRRFQKEEVAAWYRIPPHMMGLMERATHNNVEHMSIEFVKFTLLPWLTRWEQRVEKQLLLPSERGRHFVEFLVDGLLRGDVESRSQAYAVGRQWGWWSANDVRQMENQGPVEGGDVYLVPLNMVPANQAGAGLMAGPGERSVGLRRLLDVGTSVGLPAGMTDGNGAEQRAERAERGRQVAALRHRLQQVQAPVFADVIGRVLRREIADVGRQAERWLGQRSLAEFEDWLTNFYNEHETWVAEQMGASMLAYGEMVATAVGEEQAAAAADLPDTDQFLRSYILSYATRHVARSAKRLREALAQADPGEEMAALDEVWTDWRDRRPAGDGLDESGRLNNAVTLAVLTVLGVRSKAWVAFGDSCPYCTELSGMTVRLEYDFVDLAEGITVADLPPLIPSRRVGHPPAHRGCDCLIVGG